MNSPAVIHKYERENTFYVYDEEYLTKYFNDLLFEGKPH